MADYVSLPLFTDAWVADTSHLGRAERGLYLDLLVLMWRTPECRVPNDLDWISRRLRADENERATLEMVIAEFCKSDGNYITQKRLLKEWGYVRKKSKSNSAAAKSRWSKDKGSSERIDPALQTHCERNAPTPTPTPTLSVDKSTGADAPPVDPVKAVFDAGVSLLMASGVADKQARSLIGGWRRSHGDGVLLEVLTDARTRGVTVPTEWIVKALASRGNRQRITTGRAPIEATAPAL